MAANPPDVTTDFLPSRIPSQEAALCSHCPDPSDRNRETATRVAAGSIARKFLEEFGIKVGSFVENIGGIYQKKNFAETLFQNKIRKDFKRISYATKPEDKH